MSKPEQTHFVYILRCADDTLYCGYTTDIARRLTEHNGEGKLKREAAIKKLSRKEKELLLQAF